MLRDALLVHQQLGDRWRMASVLEEIAGSVLARRDAEAAVRLLACAAGAARADRDPGPARRAPDREAALARLRRRLAGRDFAAAWAEGAAEWRSTRRSTEPSSVDARADGRAGAPRIAPILTPRELAVLELLSQGQTNREIAAALYISPSTAGVHVSNILRKLGAKRRVDAAGRAHALGLLPSANLN